MPRKEGNVSNSSANTQQERTEGKATAASKLLRTILEKSLTRSFSYAAAILALVSVISITEALLLRPDEVLSGILDAAILEVTDDACGVLFERHHVRTGRFT